MTGWKPEDQRKVDEFIIFAMAAARQALDDSGWHPSSHEDQCATGVIVGSGIGGIGGIHDGSILLRRGDRGACRRSSFPAA